MISTIIPVYNGAAYLNDALDSILGQDCEPAEVIVVEVTGFSGQRPQHTI